MNLSPQCFNKTNCVVYCLLCLFLLLKYYLETPKVKPDIDILVANQIGLFKTEEKADYHRKFSRLKSPIPCEKDLYANAWILMCTETPNLDMLVANQKGLFNSGDTAAYNRRFSRIKSPIKIEKDMFFHAVEATAQRVCAEPISGNFR